jgi:DNA-binding FrmR family transcriptional regulator
MIAEDAYCPTIITQIQAVRSALASLQANLLKGHLEHCVRNELRDGSKRSTDALVSELIGIFKNTD